MSEFSIQEEAGLSRAIQERLSEAKNYNRWIAGQFMPYAGRRILDVGAAIGNITTFFRDRDVIVTVDVVREFVEEIERRFADHPNFRAVAVDIADPRVLELVPERFDTITCANVLEHVEDDAAALAHMHALLEPGGRLLLLVPAFESLWGTMDDADHHFRRYRKATLVPRLHEAGFEVERLRYMNPLGMAGWLLNGKVLRRRIVDSGQYAFYDKLVPTLSRIESVVPPPFGLSLVAVARRRDVGA